MVFLHNAVWLLVLLGVMILIHELGHFWAARYFGVGVEVFSFGFGPRLFGFRRGETDYRFSALLFGGYVKMMGAEPGDEHSDDPRALTAKPRWQRLIIAFAGPCMNVILAVGLLTGLFMVKYQKLAEPEQRGVIGHVIKDSPAARAGLQEGDRIVAVDGQKDPTWEDIELKEVSGAYRPLKVAVQRGGKQFEAQVTPVLDEKAGVGYAGWSEKGQIQIQRITGGPAEKAGLKKGDILLSANGQAVNSTFKLQEVIEHSNGKPVELQIDRGGARQTINVQPEFNLDGRGRWMIGIQYGRKVNIITTKLSLPEAFAESVHRNIKGASLIFQFLQGILERRMSAKQFVGPIGIAQLSGEAASEGPSAFVDLMAILSLNLAVVNMLPIPILDGGVILLLLVEMLMGRDLSLPVKEAVIKVGFVFLMVVMVFALYNDISRILPRRLMRRLLIRPGGIGDLIVSLPALEALRADYLEVWVAEQNVPLIRFADAVHSIGSTGLDLLEFAPAPRLVERLRAFDSIISWYGSNRPEFRDAVERLCLPFRFLPALPAGNKLHATDFYLAQVEHALRCSPSLKVPPRPREDFAVIHPFASSLHKRWPLEKFREVARLLRMPVRWCAGPQEDLPDAVRIDNLYNLACWLSQARIYIGNDSGISHLAAAVGTPAIVLFGPTDPAVWAPRGSRVLYPLDKIDPADVVAQADSLRLEFLHLTR